MKVKNDTIQKLRKLFQINISPIILTGQSKGKTISTFCMGKALVNSKNIYNRYINNILEESYKVIILVDCSGSRRNDKPCGEDVDHIIEQIIDIFYSLKAIVGKENLKIYLFNRDVKEASAILGNKIFSYSNAFDLLMDMGTQQRLDAMKKLYRWMDLEKEGHHLMAGNHDGYALKVISELKWWGSLLNNKKLIIHISDGIPNCDEPNCKMPGCFDNNSELRKDYINVVKDLLKKEFRLCGLGVDREMDEYYGEENCIQTEENSHIMLEDFINLFKSQIKEKKSIL